MVVYNAPVRDYEFLLNEVFDAVPTAQRLGHEDFDADYLSMLMEGWAEFTTEVWLPVNQLGDLEGLKFEDGNIKMPQEFKDAYREGVEVDGWPRLASPNMAA